MMPTSKDHTYSDERSTAEVPYTPNYEEIFVRPARASSIPVSSLVESQNPIASAPAPTSISTLTATSTARSASTSNANTGFHKNDLVNISSSPQTTTTATRSESRNLNTNVNNPPPAHQRPPSVPSQPNMQYVPTSGQSYILHYNQPTPTIQRLPYPPAPINTISQPPCQVIQHAPRFFIPPLAQQTMQPSPPPVLTDIMSQVPTYNIDLQQNSYMQNNSVNQLQQQPAHMNQSNSNYTTYQRPNILQNTRGNSRARGGSRPRTYSRQPNYTQQNNLISNTETTQHSQPYQEPQLSYSNPYTNPANEIIRNTRPTTIMQTVYPPPSRSAGPPTAIAALLTSQSSTICHQSQYNSYYQQQQPSSQMPQHQQPQIQQQQQQQQIPQSQQQLLQLQQNQTYPPQQPSPQLTQQPTQQTQQRRQQHVILINQPQGDSTNIGNQSDRRALITPISDQTVLPEDPQQPIVQQAIGATPQAVSSAARTLTVPVSVSSTTRPSIEPPTKCEIACQASPETFNKACQFESSKTMVHKALNAIVQTMDSFSQTEILFRDQACSPIPQAPVVPVKKKFTPKRQRVEKPNKADSDSEIDVIE